MADINSESEEDNVRSSGSDGPTKDDGIRITSKRPCCFCCTPMRFYHVTYIVLFCCYITVFPLWTKWLLCAPMPYRSWSLDLKPFPMLPMQKTYLAKDGLPGIEMSAIPKNRHSCNYTCGEELLGYRSNLMNFEVALRLDKIGLSTEQVHTSYPVLLASEDFENWQLVADRRHASPDPFFRSGTKSGGQAYIHTTEQCMGLPSGNETFTSEPIYIISCVTWHYTSNNKMLMEKAFKNKDLNKYCDSVGGVCGWPCGSKIPPERLPGCNAKGVIDDEALQEHIPRAASGGDVNIYSCQEPQEHTQDCLLTTKRFSQWPCHTCIVETEGKAEDEEDEDDDDFDSDDDDSGGGGEGGEGDDFNSIFSRRLRSNRSSISGRRLRHRRLQEMEDIMIDTRYVSLPQLQVRMTNPKVPDGVDIYNTPRSFILAAKSLAGPWTKLYTEKTIASVVQGDTPPEKEITSEGDLRNTMVLEHKNELLLNAESCFGKRGPLYLVACAVNSSIYDDHKLWRRNKKPEPFFSMGQKVAPPPFNDRCIAVAGRCGQACNEEFGHGAMSHCRSDGYIDQNMLVGDIRIQYNRVPTVLIFITVLLCGFAVRALMLCPGIFLPYKSAHDYDPEMTDQFRYIVVVSPMAGVDENKGTMIRNLIGTVSCMPPECRCRFHVVVNDEGHRNEMKTVFELFCKVIAAVPNFGAETYEKNLLELTRAWCNETKHMDLTQIGSRVKALDPKILNRLTGKAALQKLRKESKWRMYQAESLAPLEAAMQDLGADLSMNFNTFTPSTHYLDSVLDWEPKDGNLALRMHYVSRAKPIEDSRNIMVQHVAVGTWYYKVPRNASTEDWLQLRTKPKEMIYALPDNDEDVYQVPLRSSHGKAGGLNFVDNYMAVVARRPRNMYRNDKDKAPCLFAIADARHQFQPDFMLTCIPCFFTTKGVLNTRVAFTQAPQNYPEYSDSCDSMDYQNAQFFRLNAMLRNCCGGTTSCGTNSMWLVPTREDDFIWEKRAKRVRDQDSKRREILIEREQFHTSCKIEDTATSMDEILLGRHSLFVNRKLSFGMAKAPTDFIGAQQRWVEGAVTLALQWFSGSSDSHEPSARNGWMLYATLITFLIFTMSVVKLVTTNSTTSVFVEYGVLNESAFSGYFNPIRDAIWEAVMNNHLMMKLLGADSVDLEVYTTLFEQLVIWVIMISFGFSFVLAMTMLAKCFSQSFRIPFPNEVRWWGRLVIAMDNLTYFAWFWMSFYWIGFNYYIAVRRMYFQFNNVGMMAFMLTVNLLNWALLASNSFRYSVLQSVDSNEVAAMSMDNISRSNQLFFLTGPLQLFSVCRGISEFVKYKFYGQDIGGWTDSDLSAISVAIVKYWTTFMLVGCAGVWICFAIYAHAFDNSFAACVVVTMISLDVLHPCVFLWMGHLTFNQAEMAKMTCWQSIMSVKYWQSCIKSIVINPTFTAFLKMVAPTYFILLPILTLFSSYFGLTGAYMLVAMGPGH